MRIIRREDVGERKRLMHEKPATTGNTLDSLR